MHAREPVLVKELLTEGIQRSQLQVTEVDLEELIANDRGDLRAIAERPQNCSTPGNQTEAKFISGTASKRGGKNGMRGN